MFSVSYTYCTPSLSYIRLVACIALYFVNAAVVLVSASFQGQFFKDGVCGSNDIPISVLLNIFVIFLTAGLKCVKVTHFWRLVG